MLVGHSQNHLAVAGGVRRRHFRNINKIERVYDVPTHYREVVLTVSKPGSG